MLDACWQGDGVIYLGGLYIGKIRFYVTANVCANTNDSCDCEEMKEQLQAQIMGWAD